MHPKVHKKSGCKGQLQLTKKAMYMSDNRITYTYHCATCNNVYQVTRDLQKDKEETELLCEENKNENT